MFVCDLHIPRNQISSGTVFSLIELDEREETMDHVLQDLEKLNAQGLLDVRLDSPLGQPAEPQSGNNIKTTNEALVLIGPLPAKEMQNAEVPAIPPPPGWKPNRDGKLRKILRITANFSPLLSSN